MDDREERIRRRAHGIWESEGRPDGRHEHHWQQALAEDEDTPSAQSAGSAAQSDLVPEDAWQGSDRPGSLVDTGPAVGLAAGLGATGVGGLGNLSLGQEQGVDEGAASGTAGGLSSIAEAEEEARERSG